VKALSKDGDAKKKIIGNIERFLALSLC